VGEDLQEMAAVDQEARTDIATLKANVLNLEGWLKSAVMRIETQIEKFVDRMERTCPLHQQQIQALQNENTNLKAEVQEIKNKLQDYEDLKSRVKLLIWGGGLVSTGVITALVGAWMKLLLK
jgi:predicted RNase H-like nuclease (RuvC/YqgF family)